MDVNEISLSAVPCIFQAVWNYNKYNDSLKFGGRKKFNKIENKSETMFIILSWKCKGYFLRFCSQVTISLGRSLKWLSVMNMKYLLDKTNEDFKIDR